MPTYVSADGRPVLVCQIPVPGAGTAADGPTPPCLLVPLTTTPTSGVAPYLIVAPHKETTP